MFFRFWFCFWWLSRNRLVSHVIFFWLVHLSKQTFNQQPKKKTKQGTRVTKNKLLHFWHTNVWHSKDLKVWWKKMSIQNKTGKIVIIEIDLFLTFYLFFCCCCCSIWKSVFLTVFVCFILSTATFHEFKLTTMMMMKESKQKQTRN